MVVAVTELPSDCPADQFLRQAITASTVSAIELLLAKLPIVSEHDKTFDPAQPSLSWKEGRFHWLPVGNDRGNAGRIKLANQPVNPMAERIVNGMEALIELMRAMELLSNPSSPAPQSPRDAVKRYFGISSLEELPRIDDPGNQMWNKARDLARKLRLRLLVERKKGQFIFTVVVEDEGIGQAPQLIHKTLLSLGSTSKGDKPYLIGLFGQGGSSAYAVSQYSWVLSRKAPQLLHDCEDGVGWSVVKQVFPAGRRDPYFAYLASHPDGRVVCFPPVVANKVGISHGTRFAHIGYDFQKGGSAITRNLFPALNHVLYNPVLPYELYAGRDTADVMWGNAYRLSSLPDRATAKPTEKTVKAVDKTFPAQAIGSVAEQR